MFEGIAIGCSIAVWIIVCCLAYHKTNKTGISICVSSIIWLLIIFIITEGLSVFHNITSKSISLCWIVLGIGSIGYYFYYRRKHPVFHKNNLSHSLIDKDLFKDKFCIVILAIASIILLRSTWLALNTVPYNWDSMTYHLSRILFWVEHKTVSYYGTNIERQLVSPVLAEYVNLHVFLLTGSDRFFNLLQNISAYGVVLLVYELVKELGGNRHWGCIGCLLAASMNAFYAESTTTQNDVFAAFLLMTFVCQIICLNKTKPIELNRENIERFVLIGANAGLLYITKGNVAIPAAFIAIIFIVLRIKQHDKLRHLIGLGVSTFFVAFIIIFPSFFRNYKYCGDVLASEYVGDIAVGTIAPKELLINITKNYTNVAVGENNADLLKKIVYKTGEILQTDINAETISYRSMDYDISYSTYIDSASAQIIAPLLLAGVGLAMIVALLRHKKTSFVLALIVQMFVSLAFIRWQPWVTRLLIPSLCLAIPGIVYYLGEFFSITNQKGIWIAKISSLAEYIIISTLLFQCVICNSHEYSGLKQYSASGKQLSQFELYFLGRDNGTSYQKMCEVIESNGFNSIGLYTGENSYQYPIQIKWYGEKKIENVIMYKEKTEEKGINPEFVPDAILVADLLLDIESEYYCNGNSYSCIAVFDNIYSVWGKTENNIGLYFDPKEMKMPLYIDGCWTEEQLGDYRWISRYFKCIIKDEKIRKEGIMIKLGMKLDEYTQQQPEANLWAIIKINGEIIDYLPITEGINNYHFMPQEIDNNTYEIEIETNCFFNPAQLGMSEDVRDLSMQLYYLGVPSRQRDLSNK